MEIELVALDDLIPDKSNTKKHPEKNLDVIKEVSRSGIRWSPW